MTLSPRPRSPRLKGGTLNSIQRPTMRYKQGVRRFGGTPAESPAEFARTRSGVEAVIMRIGLNTTQLVLIAEDGEWLRFVVPNPVTAQQICERLKIAFHEGYSDELRKRMGSYARARREWAEAPYPERQKSTSV